MYVFHYIGASLTVSAPTVTNTSVELQWSDDTPGVTNYKVCLSHHSHELAIAATVMQVAKQY